MAQFFDCHPEQPQARLIQQAAQMIQQGGLAVIPTDSTYALVGVVGHGEVLERIRRLREDHKDHLFTLLCHNLSQIAEYARMDNVQFRFLKAITPGPYTVILEGNKELPRKVLHHKRKTVGVRIPNHVLVQGLIEQLQKPLVSASLVIPPDELAMNDIDEIQQRLDKRVDLIMYAGYCGSDETTVIDLSTGQPELLRKGLGSVEQFGLK